MLSASSIPKFKAPNDDEEMPEASPADECSDERVAVGPVPVDPVIQDATEDNDEPMAAADSEESSSATP
eukprot:6209517-Alexandrium_andersonii.AAC.1